MEASNRGSFSTCHHQPEATQLQWPLHLPGLASRNYTHTRVHAHTHTAPGLQCQVTHLMLFPPPPWPHLRSPFSPHGSHHSPPPPPAVAVRSATTCLFGGCRVHVPLCGEGTQAQASFRCSLCPLAPRSLSSHIVPLGDGLLTTMWGSY